MMLAKTRAVDDVQLGCCEHVHSSAPKALKALAISKSSVNATDPVPIVSSIRKRYVANKNIIVGGLLIHQTRSKHDACTGRFANMAGSECPESSERSTDPFGIDPVFISTSSLYDAQTQALLCCRSEIGGRVGTPHRVILQSKHKLMTASIHVNHLTPGSAQSVSM
jgi:hypothetical protein